ncbi:MAG TPA: pitrilysin family protein [Thermoanaerobaculia bacterium]|nr:pitrilysin family protein [Thermoanaerobaculia bacterium]
MKLTLAALLAVLLTEGAAFAQTQTETTKTTTTTVTTTMKELPPVAGPAKPFTLPAVKKFDLPNGLAIRLVQYGSVPKTTVRLAIQTGNADEGPNETWLADLTGEMLQQGTSSQSAEQIAREMASMGDDLNVNTGVNMVTLGADVFSESAPRFIGLLADVVEHPLFPDGELARIKQDAVRRLAIQHAQPQPLAAEKFYGALFPNSVYGRYFPTQAMLEGYTLDQVKSFYDRNYGAARARLYVVGRFDPAAIETAIHASFESWRRGNPPSVPQVAPVAKRTVYLVDRPGAVQTTLYIGLPSIESTNPDYTSYLVMDALLGGTFGSRITSNIREQKGYTYSPTSQIGSRLGAGSWVEVADVTTKDTGASIHEILGEIDRIRNTEATPDELLAIQRNEAGIFVLRNSARSAIASQLAFVDLHGLGEDYLRNYVQRIYAVTPAGVQHAAQQFIDPSKITIVAVGDKKAILDQLKTYGDVVE